MRVVVLRASLILLAALMVGGCLGDVGEPSGEAQVDEAEVGGSAQNLYSRMGNRLWTENNNIVPVCFLSPSSTTQNAERQEIKKVLRKTWSRYANIQFSDFGTCPTTGVQQFVRVALSTDGCLGACTNAFGRTHEEGMATLLPPTGAYSMSFSFDRNSTRARRDYVIVRQFGHVLGFTSEINRDDNPEAINSSPAAYNCNPPGWLSGTNYYTYFDHASIMYFCSDDSKITSRGLSMLDKRGVISAYGPARKLFHELYTTRSKNDYNGDGRADTSWYQPNTMEFVTRLSNGAGGFTEHRTDTAALGWGEWSGGRLFSRGDFNGDGKTDWSWLAPWNNQFIVMLSNGVGGWTAVGTDTSGWGPNWSGGARHFSVGDYNGDGRDDWSWYAPWSHNLIVMLSNGAGSFTSVGNNTAGWGDISNVKFFSVGDYNGDTFDDWSFYAPWSNTLLVLISAGNGRWIAEYYNDTRRFGNWSDAVHFHIGDFNGDGRDDWSWYQRRWHSHIVLLSNGGGGWTEVNNSTTGWGDISDGRYFSVGDYNGDNRDDWAFYAWWRNDFIVMLSNGNGTWTPRGNDTSRWGTWANAYPFVVGDATGDGKDDWFWYSPVTNDWTVMRSNGTGNYTVVYTEH